MSGQNEVDEDVRITDVKVDEVVKVYSGVAGLCKCGCTGTYSYNPKHQQLGSEARRYPVKDDELNLAEVERILTLVQQHADDVDDLGSGLYWLTVDDRTYCVSTVEDAKAWLEIFKKTSKSKK